MYFVRTKRTPWRERKWKKYKTTTRNKKLFKKLRKNREKERKRGRDAKKQKFSPHKTSRISEKMFRRGFFGGGTELMEGLGNEGGRREIKISLPRHGSSGHEKLFNTHTTNPYRLPNRPFFYSIFAFSHPPPFPLSPLSMWPLCTFLLMLSLFLFLPFCAALGLSPSPLE